MDITNPLIIAISIGLFKEKPTRKDTENIGAGQELDTLNVHWDIININKMCKQLNYKLYPDNLYEFDDNNIEDSSIETYWTQQQIEKLLHEKAKYLHNNIHCGMKYDCLFVIISSHGMKDYIITSDYQRITKQQYIEYLV